MGAWGRVVAILSVISLETLGLFGIHDPNAEAAVKKSSSIQMSCDSGSRIQIVQNPASSEVSLQFEGLNRVMGEPLIQIVRDCLEDHFVQTGSLDALKEARKWSLGTMIAALDAASDGANADDEEDEMVDYAIEILLDPKVGPEVVEASIVKNPPLQEKFNLRFTKLSIKTPSSDRRLSKL